MMDELPRERMGCAVEATSHLEFAFEATREYTKERMAFGGPLSNMQTVRHTMARVSQHKSIFLNFQNHFDF